jgi:2-polyprenyl-3-methyl-5-hydroxy-6-metoxy-1,4-benzoquinol methylase
VHPEQAKWDKRYLQVDTIPCACDVLIQNTHLLPASGRALDLACGLGGNSLLLAQAGLKVSSWDISSVAIQRLSDRCQEQGMLVDAAVRDVIAEPPQPEEFDVIVVSHFLARRLVKQIEAALKPNGVLFYQTFCQQKVAQIGPSNSDYLLAENELLDLFSTLRVRVYREEALIGDTEKGWRNQAMLVAQKQIRW